MWFQFNLKYCVNGKVVNNMMFLVSSLGKKIKGRSRCTFLVSCFPKRRAAILTCCMAVGVAVVLLDLTPLAAATEAPVVPGW